MLTNITEETIKFEISVISDYWDKPPIIEIAIDGIEKFSGSVTTHGLSTIKFSHTLEFNKPHQLTIKRTGKTNDQCKYNSDGTLSDQLLTIDTVVIDGVNIRNILWAYSWNEPIYPEPWASEQRQLGVKLEDKVVAETCLGHNSTWKLNFTSPFYRFVMNWMG